MNYKKEAFKRAALGIPIGIAIGATCVLVIAAIMEGNNGLDHAYYTSLNFYIMSYILSAIIGAIFGASSVIWDIEKLSLRKQAILHFIITITTHLVCAITAKWVPLILEAILIYISIYIVIYIIIFVIIYNAQKRRVIEVNKVLEG